MLNNKIGTKGNRSNSLNWFNELTFSWVFDTHLLHRCSSATAIGKSIRLVLSRRASLLENPVPLEGFYSWNMKTFYILKNLKEPNNNNKRITWSKYQLIQQCIVLYVQISDKVFVLIGWWGRMGIQRHLNHSKYLFGDSAEKSMSAAVSKTPRDKKNMKKSNSFLAINAKEHQKKKKTC